MSDTLVIEAGDPVVFSPSPDSPAAQYVVEVKPSSLEEMFDGGLISPSINIDHLREAREMAERTTVPETFFVDDEQRVFGAREVPGVILTPREVAIAQSVIQQTVRHLENRGYDSILARVTAEKAVPFVAPIELRKPSWPIVQLGDRDLDVRGYLYIDRRIRALTARNILVRREGYIFPAGNHFILKCDELHGEPPEPGWHHMVWQEIARTGFDPGPFIRGWTDRPTVADIRQRVSDVTRNWR